MSIDAKRAAEILRRHIPYGSDEADREARDAMRVGASALERLPKLEKQIVALLAVRKQAEVFAHVCDAQFMEMSRFLMKCQEAAKAGKPISLKDAIPMVDGGELPSKEIRILQLACKEADAALPGPLS